MLCAAFFERKQRVFFRAAHQALSLVVSQHLPRALLIGSVQTLPVIKPDGNSAWGEGETRAAFYCGTRLYNIYNFIVGISNIMILEGYSSKARVSILIWVNRYINLVGNKLKQGRFSLCSARWETNPLSVSPVDPVLRVQGHSSGWNV